MQKSGNAARAIPRAIFQNVERKKIQRREGRCMGRLNER
jgi:hypothetical protein